MSKSVLLVWGGIALLIGFFWVYFPTLSRYRDLKTEEEKYSRQLAEIESKIDQLKEERDLLKNDKDYLEKVIREELGLVKPGEIVYKFVQDEPQKEEPKQQLQQPQPQSETVQAGKKSGSVASPKSEVVSAKKQGAAAVKSKKSSPVPNPIPEKFPQQVLPLPPQEDNTVFDTPQPVYPRQETR